MLFLDLSLIQKVILSQIMKLSFLKFWKLINIFRVKNYAFFVAIALKNL